MPKRKFQNPEVLLYSALSFVSAALLFGLQPLVAKTVLPLLGGSPAVWNTCSFFFQFALLLGYLFAHLLSHSGRQGRLLHIALLVALMLALPMGLKKTSLDPNSPMSSLIFWLLYPTGFFAFLFSCSSPLLQSLFRDSYPDKDPYPLYAMSNLGSFVGLLAYPLLLEQYYTLATQRIILSIGTGVFALLWIFLQIANWNRVAPKKELTVAPSRIQLGTWIFLSFLASALLLAVTAHITTNIAPVPLLCALPLSIYLLGFSSLQTT